jgi:DNA-directed RNA polymerase specialized sigma24 family protein
MHAPLCPQGSGQGAGALHAAFLAILPRIERHARIAFRHLGCPQSRDDAVAEAVALAWRWYLRLVERGKDPAEFVSTFAGYAARAVKRGRRVCGQEAGQEVLSPVAQRRHGFTVAPLPVSTRRPFDEIHTIVRGQEALDAYEERLRDNAVTPPPDAAAFRLDFPRFLSTLCARDREMALFLSLGHQAQAAAARFRVSRGRVTQLRQRWCRAWRRCQGDECLAPPEAPGNQT